MFSAWEQIIDHQKFIQSLMSDKKWGEMRDGRWKRRWWENDKLIVLMKTLAQWQKSTFWSQKFNSPPSPLEAGVWLDRINWLDRLFEIKSSMRVSVEWDVRDVDSYGNGEFLRESYRQWGIPIWVRFYRFYRTVATSYTQKSWVGESTKE